MIVSEDVADGDLYWKISRGLQDECYAAESECPCLSYSVDYLAPIHKWPICPISASDSNCNPQNTQMYSCGYNHRLPRRGVGPSGPEA